MPTTRTYVKFPTTRWTLVLSAGKGGESEASAALEELCKMYWKPLVGFARRSGFKEPDAKDLTQSFFKSLLPRKLFDSADREKGRFRTFLLFAFKRHIVDARRHDQAEKRGGKVEFLSLDADSTPRDEPATSATPESEYDKDWAWTTLRAAVSRLAAEEAEAGRVKQFQELEPFLMPDAGEDAAYPKAAEALGLQAGAVRMAVLRLRRKLVHFLRQHVADTLSNPTSEQIEEEIAALKAALRS